MQRLHMSEDHHNTDTTRPTIMPASRARKETFIMALLSLLFASMFVYGTLGLIETEDFESAEHSDFVLKEEEANTTLIAVAENHKNSSTAASRDDRRIRILCIGDSLTAGVTKVGNKDWRPYAPFLEAALQNRSSLNGYSAATVYHKGYPGWTSEDLMNGRRRDDDNLTSILEDPSLQDLDLVILMAGSNDVLKGKYNSYDVSEYVIALHQFSLEQYSVPRTIALEIPGAKQYEKIPDMAMEVQVLSGHLQNYAATETRTTFVPFPFPYVDSDEKWSTDGV